MTDLYHAGGGVGLSSFRANTEKHRVMGGVSIMPAMAKCGACGKRRTAVTGSYSKSGKFTCGQCRPVFARIADMKTPPSAGCNPRVASKNRSPV